MKERQNVPDVQKIFAAIALIISRREEERQFGICQARAAGKKSRIKEKAFRKLSGLRKASQRS